MLCFFGDCLRKLSFVLDLMLLGSGGNFIIGNFNIFFLAIVKEVIVIYISYKEEF